MSGNFLKEGFKTLTTTLKDQSSTILTAIAVVGVGAVAYFAIKETPEVNKKLEETAEKKGEPLTIPEKAIIAVPGYKKTIAAAGGTIACMVGAQKQNLDKIAMYSGASVMFKDKLAELESKVEEKLGPKKVKEVREAMAEDYVMSYPPGEDNIVNTGRGVCLCMDDLTGTYFYSDKFAIERAVLKMRALITEDGSASKNQWLNLLYLDSVADGDFLGWNKYNNPFNIEYTSCITPDGRPCLVIQHVYNLPVPDYEQY